MKILVLYKRHNMGIDSLCAQHGRMQAICQGLQDEGHDLHVIVSDYHPNRPNVESPERQAFPFTILPLRASSFLDQIKAIHKMVDRYEPDLIIAGSDALQIIIASLLVKTRSNLPFFADLKDNYEYFGLTRVPAINFFYRKALRNAKGIICVSTPLETFIREKYSIHNTFVLENFADENRFQPLSRVQSRLELGLPAKGFFLGTAGALTRSRGISVLSRAYELATSTHQNSTLIVAGTRDKSWQAPRRGNFIDLGFLSPTKVPLLLNSLDVGIICNLDSKFGRFCYPQKYCEMLACGLPVIASETGIFSKEKDQLGVLATYSPSNAEDLKDKIEQVYKNLPTKTTAHDLPTPKQRVAGLSDYLYRYSRQSD